MLDDGLGRFAAPLAQLAGMLDRGDRPVPREHPGVPADERRELASALAADGRFLDAAATLDELADVARVEGAGALVDEAESGAIRLRARLN